jgi:hypothetical protein
MKTRKSIAVLMTALAALLITSCENSLLDNREKTNGILPASFKIDLPASLSQGDLKSTAMKSTATDTLNGNHIYWYLNAFIAVGEGAADIVQSIIWHIAVYHIDDVISLSYTSQDDNRVKNLDVVSQADYQGRTYEYMLTITDAESEGNADGGVGMRVYWNREPIEGVALFKPYNLDRKKNAEATEATGSITYSEKATEQYDVTMVVEIAGLPLPNPAWQPYALESMKMFVGKKGDVIDVIGNSNHPNARFNTYDTENKGYNWAFVASGDKTKDIAVAEVGLPYSHSDLTTRDQILGDYSIKKVLTREMTNYVVSAFAAGGFTLRPDEVAGYLTPYLKNADAPGFFDKHGFIKGGSAPSTAYSTLELRIRDLVPYNPSDLNNLMIPFEK